MIIHYVSFLNMEARIVALMGVLGSCRSNHGKIVTSINIVVTLGIQEVN